MRDAYFAVAIKYDHGSISATDVNDAIEEHLFHDRRGFMSVSVVRVQGETHARLADLKVDE